MTWLDDLVPCTFGGIAFHSRNLSGSQGRNQKVHLRLNAEPLTEDLGAAPRGYTIRGYFVQNRENPNPYRDYLRLRDLVLKGGVQRFVHPHFGDVPYAKAVSIVETVSNKSGGFISFNLSLDANREVGYSAPTQPTDVALTNRAAAVRTAAQRLFGPEVVANFDPVTPIDLSPDSPFKRFRAIQSPIEETGFVASLQRVVDQVKSARGALQESGAAAFRRLDDALSGPAQLYRDGSNLASDIGQLLDGFQGASSVSGPLEIVEFFQRNPITSRIRGDTVYHQHAADNDAALTNLTTLLGISALGDAVSRLTESGTGFGEPFLPSSRNAAAKVYKRISDSVNTANQRMLDGRAERTANALRDFNSALADFQDEHLPQLSKVRSVEVQNRNAYYASYRYLNDAGQTTRLVEENNALHPFKLPENVDLAA